jgi:predicted DCC family thiol-disulfide oxidoreductase YuxK
MTGSTDAAGTAPDTAHLVLYDGVCGLCSRIVQFVVRHDRRGVFGFAPLQDPLGRSIVAQNGGDPDAPASFYVVAEHRADTRRALTRSDAALFIARELGWPWKAAGLFSVLPRALRDRGYDFVARHRHRVFGEYDQCLLPGNDRPGTGTD